LAELLLRGVGAARDERRDADRHGCTRGGGRRRDTHGQQARRGERDARNPASGLHRPTPFVLTHSDAFAWRSQTVVSCGSAPPSRSSLEISTSALTGSSTASEPKLTMH